MELLAVYEKHTTRLFKPDDDGTYLTSFKRLLDERIDEGWYQDDGDKEDFLAQAILEEVNKLQTQYALGKHVSFEEVYKKLLKFMKSRRTAEYEDWEFVEVENGEE